jgi:hypothetical protein
MKLKDFLQGRGKDQIRKYRTINLDEDLHLFLKRTANHYNMSLADLTHNILSNWKNQYQEDIQKDIANDLNH